MRLTEEAKAGLENLLDPPRLWSRTDVLLRPCPVPRKAGVYAWYFGKLPPGVPANGCHVHRGTTLLYVGISPKKPPGNGAPPSRQRLFDRVRYHFRGNAYGSTLRLTLGCLLADCLGIQLQRVGSGRLTFGPGEAKISEWMEENAFVAWTPTDIPWELEHHLIGSLSLPLNLAGNSTHPFYASLTEARRRQKLAANSPVLESGSIRADTSSVD